MEEDTFLTPATPVLRATMTDPTSPVELLEGERFRPLP